MKNLMVEENHFKVTGGSVVSIKIKAFEKSVIICACSDTQQN